MTTTETEAVVTELPPLQEGRLYSADEASLYVRAKPLWLKRALRAGRIDGGYLGRTPVWSAEHIRNIIAAATANAATQKPAQKKGRRSR